MIYYHLPFFFSYIGPKSAEDFRVKQFAQKCTKLLYLPSSNVVHALDDFEDDARYLHDNEKASEVVAYFR